MSQFILRYLVSSKKLGDLKKNLAFSEYFRISSIVEGCIFIQTLILFWGKLKPSPNKSALLLNIKLTSFEFMMSNQLSKWCSQIKTQVCLSKKYSKSDLDGSATKYDAQRCYKLCKN